MQSGPEEPVAVPGGQQAHTARTAQGCGDDQEGRAGYGHEGAGGEGRGRSGDVVRNSQ